MSKTEVVLFYVEGRWDSIEAFRILTDNHIEFSEQKMDSTSEQFGELPSLAVGNYRLNGLEEIRSYVKGAQFPNMRSPDPNHNSEEDEESVN